MDADLVRDLFAAFGPVEVRRLFGGLGVYADGVMFAMVMREVVYLKCAPENSARFVAEGCGPFAYDSKTGARTITSYWRVPDRLYDDSDELAAWARTALATARVAQSRKSQRNAPRSKARVSIRAKR